MSESYVALLGRPHARRLLGALAAAWLSFGMVGLAVFLAVHRATASFGIAGVAVGAFSIGSGALAPFRGRVLDRRGVHPWLPILATFYGLSLALLALFARLEPIGWLLVFFAGVAGASAPPLVASVRALWSTVVEGPLLRRAYALTSLIGDVGLVAAPALAGLIFVVAPWSPLVVAGLAALLAALVVARGARTRQAPVATRARSRSPLGSAAMRMLLVVSVALGFALGLVEVAVPTAATRWGIASYSGFLLGAFALGSVAGGLWFGRQDWKRPPQERYLLAVFVLALLLAPPLAAANAAILAPLLVVAGLGYGPATISLFEALDVLAPANRTEAFTWVTTAEAIGIAAGAAAAGWATAGLGTWAPFAAASTVLAAVAAAAMFWGHRRRGRRSASRASRSKSSGGCKTGPE
jgi:MFS family permease